MTPLIIEVDGRILRLEGDRTIRIGRAIEADIVLTAGSVSRKHAAIRPVEGVWTLADAGSNYGTYVDGRPITLYPITGRVEVTCGPDAPGARLTIYPENAAPDALAAPSHAPAAVPPPMPFDASPFGMEGMPGAFPSPDPAPAAPAPQQTPQQAPQIAWSPIADDPLSRTRALSSGSPSGPGGVVLPPSGPDLLLIAEGREHRFRHPTHITIGRHPDSTVVLTDPAASRAHGQITPVAGGWTYGNLSNEGTFLGGRRVTTTKVDDRMQLRLGHPTAGPELTVVPILSAAEEEKRIARRKRRRVLTTVAAAVAVLVLIAGVIVGATWFFDRDDNTSAADPRDEESSSEAVDSMRELTKEELDKAEAATVMLYFESTLVENPSAKVAGSGSGSIISEDGLILTNAHVATPEDEDIVEYYGTPPDQVVADPEYLTVFLTDPETGEVQDKYRAEVVASDGVLDAAVLQIVSDQDGGDIDPDELDLPAIERGDSDDVELNDDVTILGFPAIASSDPYQLGKSVTVTEGSIATILRDVDEFDTDARVSPGNSGGLAVDNDARLIAIPTKGRGDAQGNVSSRLRMINAVEELIEEAEEAE